LQFIQHFPDFRRQSDRPRTSVFPEYGDLAGFTPGAEIAPAQSTGLRNAQTSRVEELEQDLVPERHIDRQKALDVLFGDDPFRQSLLVWWQGQLRRGVRRQIPSPATEGKQTLYRCQRTDARNGSQSGFDERLIEVLKVAKPNRVEWLANVRQEAVGVAPVAGSRVRAGLAVQP
jgi:hypothetical protein